MNRDVTNNYLQKKSDMNKWELGVLRQKTTVGVKVVRGLTLTVHAMYSEFTATGDGAEKEKGGEDGRGCK